jgi:Ca2+-transporting ATPase
MPNPGLALALLEPTNLLLLSCALIYALIGERSEAWILLVFVAGITLLDGVQQRRSQKALAELARLSAPRARVLRGDQELNLPPEAIETGDGLRLEEGDRVAADGVLEEAIGLWIDTALLTGEALPVQLAAGDRILAGSLVAQGRGRSRVTAAAGASELGQLAASLQQVEPPPHPSAAPHPPAHGPPHHRCSQPLHGTGSHPGSPYWRLAWRPAAGPRLRPGRAAQ